MSGLALVHVRPVRSAKYQDAYSSKPPCCVNLILTSGKLCDSEIDLKFITAAYRSKNAYKELSKFANARLINRAILVAR